MSSPAETDRVALDVARRFEALPEIAGRDEDIVRRGRFLTCDFKLGVGALPLLVSVVAGRVTAVARGPFLLRPWAFSLTAAPEIWARFLEPVPVAGMHDILALSKTRQLLIEGDLRPFMANLQVVKDIVAAPRARLEATR